MKFNPLIPELTVADIETTRAFYTGVLRFKVEYERPEDRFIFLSLEGNQLMFEQENGHWRVGALEHPYGRGVNFEMTVNRYRQGGEDIVQREFLVQDPDGYLLRFTD